MSAIINGITVLTLEDLKKISQILPQVTATDNMLLVVEKTDGTGANTSVGSIRAPLVPLTQKGASNGVATLGSDGKIPASQIPALALVDVFTVASESEMLALDAEQGDMAIRTDTNTSYILSASPASTLENWVELAGLSALIQAHAGRTDNPHLVTKTQVGLGNVDNTSDVDKPVSGPQQEALDLKLDKSDVVDNFDGGATKALSAEKGKDLDTRITKLEMAYYGLRRRSDGLLTSTGAAATMVSSRSNGTYNPTLSDFRKVRPWSDIRLCLMDRVKNVVAVQGDDNFLTMANAKNGDGSHVWNFGSLFYPFYQRIWEGVDDNSYAFKEWDVSAVRLPGYEMHPAFIREDGTIRPYIVLNSFKTGLDVDGKVCSKPGVVPLTNTSTLSFDTKYSELDVDTGWMGNHFTTNDVWKILVCIEYGTMDIQAAVGQGISSSMPYSSSSNYQLTAETTSGNTVTIEALGQPFYVGMDVQIGSSYANNAYALNRKVVSIDTTTIPGSMLITVDGDPFSAPIGGWIVTWGQSDSVDNLLQLGTGCGWISQWDSESRSHAYIYGMVDPYANVFEFERGKMRKNKHFFINFNPLTSSGITDPESSGYTDCGEFSTGAATYGWISDFKIVTLGIRQTQLVSAVGGNSIGDVIYYADDSRTGIYVCSRGGNWSNGSGSGPFYGYWSYGPANTNIYWGDRGIILEPVLQAS